VQEVGEAGMAAMAAVVIVLVVLVLVEGEKMQKGLGEKLKSLDE
jgi:hypothetical protein